MTSAQTADESSLRIQPGPQVPSVLSVQASEHAERQAALEFRGANPEAITGTPHPQVAFPSSNVGTISSSYITFSTTFSASTTVTGDAVYTLGASGSDFKNVGTGTCDTNGFPYTYAASSSCTTTVSFTPSKPGNRMGSEVLYTSTAGSYYYGYVNGIGLGPQMTFAPATPVVSTLASGLSAYNSALDGAGDLWVTDSTAGAVKEFVPSGGVSQQPY